MAIENPAPGNVKCECTGIKFFKPATKADIIVQSFSYINNLSAHW